MRVLEILFHQDREVPETEQAPVFRRNFSRHATHFNVLERCLQFGQPAGFGDRRTVWRMKPLQRLRECGELEPLRQIVGRRHGRGPERV